MQYSSIINIENFDNHYNVTEVCPAETGSVRLHCLQIWWNYGMGGYYENKLDNFLALYILQNHKGRYVFIIIGTASPDYNSKVHVRYTVHWNLQLLDFTQVSQLGAMTQI